MKKQFSYALVAGAVTLALAMWGPVSLEAEAKKEDKKPVVVRETPMVYQAAGPTAPSIQSALDEFRAALGGDNNGNTPGPIETGRREINWDGGGNNPATSPGPTPFQVFLASRGADITTPGTGFVQAPPSGLADTFGDPALADIFQAFSPLRLFAPVGSNVTRVDFFVPGGTNIPADTSAFGVVLSDVDRGHSTRLRFLDAHGRVLYATTAPASPGTATFSFIGVQFKDARIASVQIITGNDVLDLHKKRRGDLVVMDDFVYAEPQAQK